MSFTNAFTCVERGIHWVATRHLAPRKSVRSYILGAVILILALTAEGAACRACTGDFFDPDCEPGHEDREVWINGDVNHDGVLNFDDYDFRWKLNSGLVVVADKDEMESVYNITKPDHALRRKIRLWTGDGKPLFLARSSTNLLLYSNEQPGLGEVEIFGASDQVQINPGVYWLQGGAASSIGCRADYLTVRGRADQTAPSDGINVTVIWVDLVGHTDPSEAILSPPYCDGYQSIVDMIGTDLLGVHGLDYSTTSSGPFGDLGPGGDPWEIYGVMEYLGMIHPHDLAFPYDNMPTNFVEGRTAIADFGFIFRRFVSFRWYWNGRSAHMGCEEGDNQPDDSQPGPQDVTPDLLENPWGPDWLIISDLDAPTNTVRQFGIGPNYPQYSFGHTRDNFLEHVVFNFVPRTPERCSKRLPAFFSSDAAMAYDDLAVFIFEPPNGPGTRNVARSNANLPNLNLNLPANAPVMTSANNLKDHSMVIINVLPDDEFTVIHAEGHDLVGEFRFGQDGGGLKFLLPVKVKRTDESLNFSNIQEARLFWYFNEYWATSPPAYTLYLGNDSAAPPPITQIGGFEMRSP
jgi:hypothetical protein